MSNQYDNENQSHVYETEEDEVIDIEQVAVDDEVLQELEQERESTLSVFLRNFDYNYSPAYFRDQHNQLWIRLNTDRGNQFFDPYSKEFTKFIVAAYDSFYRGVSVTDKKVKEIVELLQGRVSSNYNDVHFCLRVAENEANRRFYYDLGYSTVEITSDGWSVDGHDDVFFYRPEDQKPQVQPISDSSAQLDHIFEFVNISEHDRFLFQIALVSALIPGIEHPIIYFYGNETAGKTVTSTVVKRLIDPTVTDSTGLNNEKGLRELAKSNWCILFDNVTKIKEEQSEALCRVTTDDNINLGSIIINSREILSTKDDFISRALLFNIERGDDFCMRQKSELLRQFDSEKPRILAAMFTVLSQAIGNYHQVEAPGIHRLLDFERWAVAIGEAITEGGGQRFIEDYRSKVFHISSYVLVSSRLGAKLLGFMHHHPRWEGSASELLYGLEGFSDFEHNIDIPPGRLPGGPQALSRALNSLAGHLRAVGIEYSNVHSNEGSVIRLWLQQ